MPEIETPKVVELSKPSKLDRIKSAAITTGIFVIPTVVSGGLLYVSVKMTKMQLDTAKLNLETARLTKNV